MIRKTNWFLRFKTHYSLPLLDGGHSYGKQSLVRDRFLPLELIFFRLSTRMFYLGYTAFDFINEARGAADLTAGATCASGTQSMIGPGVFHELLVEVTQEPVLSPAAGTADPSTWGITGQCDDSPIDASVGHIVPENYIDKSIFDMMMIPMKPSCLMPHHFTAKMKGCDIIMKVFEALSVVNVRVDLYVHNAEFTVYTCNGLIVRISVFSHDGKNPIVDPGDEKVIEVHCLSRRDYVTMHEYSIILELVKSAFGDV